MHRDTPGEIDQPTEKGRAVTVRRRSPASRRPFPMGDRWIDDGCAEGGEEKVREDVSALGDGARHYGRCGRHEVKLCK